MSRRAGADTGRRRRRWWRRKRLDRELRLAVRVVVGPMSVPRTTSGKIQRARTREELRVARLDPLHSDLPSDTTPACP